MREWFTNDLGWKLFSLALAAGIWFIVRPIDHDPTVAANPPAPGEIRVFPRLPVLVVSAASDVREFKVQPSTVEVTVRADHGIMTALAEKDIHAMVDLSDIASARDLRKRVDVSAPPGVTVTGVSPETVDVVVPPKRAP